MQQAAIELRREQIAYSGLSLAMYREVAAHLRQVEGITTELIPQHSEQFDYNQSQVSGLLIEYGADLDVSNQQRVEEILNHYACRYGSYQRRMLNL